ncbi:MAG: hypothetical protein ACK4K7_10230 [Allosphingosinicella sp.]|uniref:hypothetical protein n=1 Tax=Allosphingosinicella sp. TaxID=2823234 RepID=UPI003933254C
MSLSLAQRRAFDLAKSLMVCVVLIQTADGYSVMPTAEFDGPADAIVHEYDPFS